MKIKYILVLMCFSSSSILSAPITAKITYVDQKTGQVPTSNSVMYTTFEDTDNVNQVANNLKMASQNWQPNKTITGMVIVLNLTNIPIQLPNVSVTLQKVPIMLNVQKNIATTSTLTLPITINTVLGKLDIALHLTDPSLQSATFKDLPLTKNAQGELEIMIGIQ